jgi:hypothetical protein
VYFVYFVVKKDWEEGIGKRGRGRDCFSLKEHKGCRKKKAIAVMGAIGLGEEIP